MSFFILLTGFQLFTQLTFITLAALIGCVAWVAIALSSKSYYEVDRERQGLYSYHALGSVRISRRLASLDEIIALGIQTRAIHDEVSGGIPTRLESLLIWYYPVIITSCAGIIRIGAGSPIENRPRLMGAVRKLAGRCNLPVHESSELTHLSLERNKATGEKVVKHTSMLLRVRQKFLATIISAAAIVFLFFLVAMALTQE